jgi:hypothetical protein
MALFALAYSSHLLWYWPLGKTWYHHTSLSSAPLSQELPILPNSFLERESWSQLYQMFLIAPSLIMPPSIQIRFGVEAMWKKVWLFTRSCFHAEFLEFQSYSTNRNYFDIDSKQTHSEEIQVIPMERFSDVMKTFCFWRKCEDHEVTFGWSRKVEISILGLLRTVFRRKCEKHKVTSGGSQKVEISIWGLLRTVFQSIHFICMNNDFVSHEKALPTDPDCLPLIRKGLIRHVM